MEPTEEETLLFSLVYCSSAAKSFAAVDLENLVGVAKRNNACAHITGWLVYSAGIFFQWLEGSRAAVKQLMTIIEADARHHNVVILTEAEEVRERLFSEWDMELVSPEDIRAVLFDAIDASSDDKSTAALHRLIQELDASNTATT